MTPVAMHFSASGLMIASRYPVLEVNFKPMIYTNSLWQRAICYGVIMAKLDLGNGNVGYIANLHNVAYQVKNCSQSCEQLDNSSHFFLREKMN